MQANKRIADAKLAKDFQSVLKEFQKAQRISAERETVYDPFVPQAALSPRYHYQFNISIDQFFFPLFLHTIYLVIDYSIQFSSLSANLHKLVSKTCSLS